MSTCKIPVLKEWLEERKTMQQVLKQHLHQARHIMNVQSDKKHTHHSLNLEMKYTLNCNCMCKV